MSNQRAQKLPFGATGGGVSLAIRRWDNDPRATVLDIAVSAIGQLWFWTGGQDFIGIGMNPKWLPGMGHKLAPRIQRHLPDKAATAWMLKFIEIASDATKMPIEGRLYRQVGIVPDVVGAALTQPLWSGIEVTEKLIGVIRHPERINTPQQIADSLSSIYGTWTRNILSLLFFRYGRQLRNKLGRPQTVFA